MIILVCGAPCSGKSTYVRERAEPGDLVVDFDDLAVQLGSPRTHQHDYPVGRRAARRFDELVAEIADGKHARAWVIRCAANHTERALLTERINADEVVVLTPDRRTLHTRAAQRPNPRQARADIDKWLATYARTQW